MVLQGDCNEFHATTARAGKSGDDLSRPSSMLPRVWTKTQHLRDRMTKALAWGRRLSAAAQQRGLLAQAAALSWITMLALVPLLATFSFLGARLLSEYRSSVLVAAEALLPWSEATVLARIEELVAQAEGVREIGAIGFFITTLGLFDAVERAINRQWGISRHRSLGRRLGSLAQMVIWGPVAIVVGVLVLRWLEDVLLGRQLGRIFVAAVVFAALVMLYKQVPATRVTFRAAVVGALVATVLLELLRRGLGAYTAVWLEQGPNIYGSLALAVLFLISIHLGWLALLLGALASAVRQRGIVASLDYRADPWIGLAAMLALARRFLAREPPPVLDTLGVEVGAEPDVLDATVAVLAAAGFIHREAETGLLVLTASPILLEAEEILAAFPAPTNWRDDPVGTAMTRALAASHTGRRRELGQKTLADLLAAAPAAVEVASESTAPTSSAPEPGHSTP